MRIEFHTAVQTNKEYLELLKKWHWAAKVVRVGGGYRAFESMDDYDNWKK